MLAPVGKRIIVKPVEVKHGALIITGQKPSQYEVISIGDEITKVKAGSIIYLEKHCGCDIEHDKEKYIVVDEESILAKIVD